PDDADESGTVEDELAADSRPAPSPPHHLPRREAEPLVLSPQHGKDHAKDNEEQLSSDDDDDVFLDVILDDDNEDEDVPPLANHHPCDSPDSSDSDAPDDITHPPKHFAQPPVTRTKGAQLPATPVATIPISTTSTMPSLTVLNVMSSTPVDVVPSVTTSPARSSSSSFKATTRPIKTRLHMVDSDNDLSSSPVAATSKAMLPSTSGDHEFVVEKSSSFWSDDDDDNDEDEKVFVGNTNSPTVGRNAAAAARPVKPTAAAAPPAAAAAAPLNASVLAAIEQARRAALEMLPSTATVSTPASFGSRGGVSDEEVALPTRKVKADQPKKKKHVRNPAARYSELATWANEEITPSMSTSGNAIKRHVNQRQRPHNGERSMDRGVSLPDVQHLVVEWVLRCEVLRVTLCIGELIRKQAAFIFHK
ncbi:hypothetical protein DYB36_014071, partial [Aphanomyces astaci]